MMTWPTARLRAIIPDISAARTQACRTLQVNRSTVRYASRADDQAVLRMRIKDIAAVGVRYGYLRIHTLLRREGFKVNRKRVYRLYREEGLNLRHAKRPRRQISAARRPGKLEPTSVNEVWCMDFVSDALYNGKRLRLLTVLDVFTRESLAIHVGQGIKGSDVADVLEELGLRRGLPEKIRCGPEFISKVLDKWAYENGVNLGFTRPGKPTDNAYIESFNGRFREECLSANWFMPLDDANTKVEA